MNRFLRKTIMGGGILMAFIALVSCANQLVDSQPQSMFAARAPVITPGGDPAPVDSLITITTETPGATIHYTLDGSTPGPDSTVYTSPISLPAGNNRVTLKAIATKPSINPSSVTEAEYSVRNTVAWVMSYFKPSQNRADDALFLAWSTDGLHWTNLNSGVAVYLAPTTIGGVTGVGQIRDPYLYRKQDGTFLYIATDWTVWDGNNAHYWWTSSGKVFMADSSDLITFTNPRLVTLASVLGANSNPHAWAPEVYWDSILQKNAIIWSGNPNRNLTYVSYTSDFVTIDNPTPSVFFDPGYDEIDATLTKWNGYWYLFFKGEEGSGKDIRVAKSNSGSLSSGMTPMTTNWLTRGSDQNTSTGVEGPLIIRDHAKGLWYLYADFYGAGGVFGCWSTSDLDINPMLWKKLSTSAYSLPAGVRHANTVRVTQAELTALQNAYP